VSEGLDLPRRLLSVGIAQFAHPGDHLRRALGDALHAAVGRLDGGLGPLADRIEGYEFQLGPAFQHRSVFESADHGEVDRVVVLGLAGERPGEDALLFILRGEERRVVEGQLVLGQRPGLVGAEDVDAGHLLDRLEPGDDRLLLRHGQRAERHGDRKHRGHGDRNRSDGQDQHKFHQFEHLGELDVAVRQMVAVKTDGDQDQAKPDAHHDEEVADAHHRLLEVGDVPGPGHQFGGAPEEGIPAGGGDHGDHLALLGDRAGVDGVADLLADRERFAGQRGLVDAEVFAVDQDAVGGNHIAQPDADHIARNHLRRIDFTPDAVAQDAGLESESFFQRVEGIAGLVLLPETDEGVEHQHKENDVEIVEIPRDQRKQRGGFDHPRNRPPEVLENLEERVALLLLQRIGAALGQPFPGLGSAQAGSRTAQFREQLLLLHRPGGFDVYRIRYCGDRLLAHKCPSSVASLNRPIRRTVKNIIQYSVFQAARPEKTIRIRYSGASRRSAGRGSGCSGRRRREDNSPRSGRS